MMRSVSCKRYGILDDFGSVIRLTWDKPVGREYVVQVVAKVNRYEVALAACGEALI